MTTKKEHQLFTGPVSGFAFNADQSKLVTSDSSEAAFIFHRDGSGKYTKETELVKHIERITSVDWAPKSNRIVTCSGDRNAYVWNWTPEAKEWKPSLVLLRIERAATYVRWSPKEDRFAVGSGARLLSICYYDAEHDWWISKHIKKPIRSTILCVDWHPNSYIIAIGSCDFKCRVFSSALKELADEPETSGWMPKKQKFGALLGEFSVSEGWVHGVKFSPSGDKVAWVSHDSSINMVDGSSQDTIVRVATRNLPLLSVIWLSETSLVVGGHDNCPFLYNLVGEELVFGARLDVKQARGGGGMSAMARFKQMDNLGTSSGGATTTLDTTHQNAITEIRVTKETEGKVKQFCSAGADGKLILWEVDALVSSIAGLKI